MQNNSVQDRGLNQHREIQGCFVLPALVFVENMTDRVAGESSGKESTSEVYAVADKQKPLLVADEELPRIRLNISCVRPGEV